MRKYRLAHENLGPPGNPAEVTRLELHHRHPAVDERLLEQYDEHAPHDDQQNLEPEPLHSFKHQTRLAGRQRYPDHGRGLDYKQRDNAPGIK